MSVSVAFQDLIIARLKASTDVVNIVGDGIYDGVPSTAQHPYISLGASDLRTDDADCIKAREETIQIDCWTRSKGRIWPCRELVDAVVRALDDDLQDEDDMTEGALVSLSVELSRAFMEPDNETGHGVVQVTGLIDEGV